MTDWKLSVKGKQGRQGSAPAEVLQCRPTWAAVSAEVNKVPAFLQVQ